MSSTILVATPAPTQLPTIYRAGDLLIQNPQQTCVIFVTVILLSAFLEYFLERVSNVENRYARVLVNTMSQEITIVGVLALFLMFAISVIPREVMKPLYVQLFNWANISLFFLAVMFVFVVVVQFGWCSVETRFVWKAFEEGTLETEELAKLKYPHAIFKQVHELYRQELLAKSGLPTGAVPFNEYTALIWRRSLVRLSNLTFRTWFFLSFVIILNLVRIMFIPWAEGLTGNDLAFFNQLTLMGILGWGMFLSYVFFFLLLQFRLSRLASGKITLSKDEPAYKLIPCGTLKRAVEYIQILIFSYNWYVVLFITGGYRQVSDMSVAWQKAVLFVMFFLPMVIFMISLPWCLHSMAMLHIIGNVNSKVILGIFRRIRGEGEEEEDMDDDDDVDDEAEQVIQNIARQIKMGNAASSDKGSVRSKQPRAMRDAAKKKHHQDESSSAGGGGGLKSGMLAGTKDADEDENKKKDRPGWAEDDDDWDGTTTLAYGERRTTTEKNKVGALFLHNADTDRIKKELRRMGAIAPDPEEAAKLAAAQERAEKRAQEEAAAAAAAAARAPGPKGKGGKGMAPNPKGKAAMQRALLAKRATSQLTAKQKAAAEEKKKKEEEAKKKEKKANKGPRRPAFLDSDEEWDPEEGVIPKKE